MQDAVERVIADMWDRYDEPLTLAEMADIAIVSRFYFSRVFHTITGTSPGRFLTAIRLYKAKNLLLETELSVTDISYRVGYNSLGTFTSRFTKSVGISPARFRAMSKIGIEPPARSTAAAAPGGGSDAGSDAGRGAVHGALRMPETNVMTRVYVGGFATPIPQGMPVACDILESAGCYRLEGLPVGRWFVHAAAVALQGVDPRPWNRRPLLVGESRPVDVVGGHSVVSDILMRPVRPTDLPILVALPELDSRLLPQPTVQTGPPVLQSTGRR